MNIHIVKHDVPFEFGEVVGVYIDEDKARGHITEMTAEGVKAEEAVIECWEVEGDHLWAECLDGEGHWLRCNIMFHLLDGHVESRSVPRDLPDELSIFIQMEPVIFVKDDGLDKPCYRQKERI
jgi:hypothetical protein